MYKFLAIPTYLNYSSDIELQLSCQSDVFIIFESHFQSTENMEFKVLQNFSKMENLI